MVPEPVWMFFRGEKFVSVSGFEPQIVQFVGCILSTLSQLAVTV